MNKRQSRKRDDGTKDGGRLRETHIKESVTPKDGLPASDVNMSVWDFGRKMRGATNGEDLIGDITTIKAAEWSLGKRIHAFVK